MISENDLVYIVRLFVQGLVIGGLLSAVPWMLGYAIGKIIEMIRRV